MCYSRASQLLKMDLLKYLYVFVQVNAYTLRINAIPIPIVEVIIKLYSKPRDIK